MTLVVTGVALGLLLVAGAAALSGTRWFVVETPSMGRAAPVGSLVVTRPDAGPVQGDVIAFVAPGTGHVYTHRIQQVEADGSVRTKGDINGARDPWLVPRSAVLGRAAAILPGAGFAVRGLPVLVGGALLVQLVTLPIRRRDRRTSARILGLHLVATAVLLWVQPLIRVVLIASDPTADGVRASIVSTGLLPIRLVTSAGEVLAHLGDGMPRTVLLPAVGADRVMASPDLGPVGQALLIGIAVLPALLVLAVGLPRDEETAS